MFPSLSLYRAGYLLSLLHNREALGVEAGSRRRGCHGEEGKGRGDRPSVPSAAGWVRLSHSGSSRSPQSAKDDPAPCSRLSPAPESQPLWRHGDGALPWVPPCTRPSRQWKYDATCDPTEKTYLRVTGWRVCERCSTTGPISSG